MDGVGLHEIDFHLQCKLSQRCLFYGQTLEEQLNTCKDSEPAAAVMISLNVAFVTSTGYLFQQTANFLTFFVINTGLNYIIEYQSKDNFSFVCECQLCHYKTGLSNMFMYVCGSKHRLAYLIGCYRFSNNEEKMASMCETNKPPQEENEEVEVNIFLAKQQDFTANPEEFMSQEELLSYLVSVKSYVAMTDLQFCCIVPIEVFSAELYYYSFEILNGDDASFILKVTQTLTDALVEYRQQAASKKDLIDAEYNGEAALEYYTEWSDLTSADISDTDTGNVSFVTLNVL
ncbi:hypothetical protein Q9233_012580 [Columba guinea]|nr:hypothetical protein Q9233_012580 [Columba guinea]